MRMWTFDAELDLEKVKKHLSLLIVDGRKGIRGIHIVAVILHEASKRMIRIELLEHLQPIVLPP